VKLTDGGRQVYGEGGITPDVVVQTPKANDFQEDLERRGVFYPSAQGVGDFVRFYLGEKPAITKDFSTDDAVLAQFRKFLSDHHVPFTEQDLQQNLDWLKWEIKREVFTTVFGLNEGYKVALEDDPQLDKAVESIPQAKALYANVRKVLAEREAPGPVRPTAQAEAGAPARP